MNKKFNFNQVDLDISRWLPELKGTGRGQKGVETRNRTILRLFFEELRNTNNPVEAMRNIAPRLAPFGISQHTLLEVTRKWREGHGLKRTVIWTTSTRAMSVSRRLLAAASIYFDAEFESTDALLLYITTANALSGKATDDAPTITD